MTPSDTTATASTTEDDNTPALSFPENLNAYQLAWRCCEDFHNREKPLPAWPLIRALIGKGSANDINRAKQDFIQEQLRIARQSRLGGQGLPERLQPLFQQFWQSAIDQAESNIKLKMDELEKALQRAEAQRQSDETSLQQLKTLNREIESEKLVLNQTLQEAQQVAQSERLAKEGLERQLSQYIAALDQQKQALQSALDSSALEVKKALDRLEAMEDRSLLEIERVKDEYRDLIKGLEDQLKLINAESVIAIRKAESIAEMKSQELMSLHSKNDFLIEELNSNKNQMHILQKNYDALFEQNHAYLEIIKQLSIKPSKSGGKDFAKHKVNPHAK